MDVSSKILLQWRCFGYSLEIIEMGYCPNGDAENIDISEYVLCTRNIEVFDRFCWHFATDTSKTKSKFTLDVQIDHMFMIVNGK